MRLYTAQEMSELLKLHPRTIYRLGRSGELKTVRVGRSVRFIQPMVERSRNVKREIKRDTAV